MATSLMSTAQRKTRNALRRLPKAARPRCLVRNQLDQPGRAIPARTKAPRHGRCMRVVTRMRAAARMCVVARRPILRVAASLKASRELHDQRSRARAANLSDLASSGAVATTSLFACLFVWLKQKLQILFDGDCAAARCWILWNSRLRGRGGPGGMAGLAPMASIFYNIPARNIFDRKKYQGISLP